MPRKPAHVPLGVWLNGRLVGHLRRSGTGAIDFSYHRDWLAWPAALPISLSLPLREARYTGEPVFAVFDNLLPDDASIRSRVAERTGAEGTDPFHLLSAIGHDCVGALQFLPQGAEPEAPGGLRSRPIGDGEIAYLLDNLSRSPLGLDEDSDFRISIAGAQEKTALLVQRGRFRIPLGTTATTHILKPQIGKRRGGLDLSDSVENEHLCMRFVAALGLPTARTEIRDFDGVRALVVERFDRIWTDGKERLLRIPQEDFCQALGAPSARKYQSDGGPSAVDALRLLQGSDDPAADRRRFLHALLAYWLLGATDGHAKNFSIQLFPESHFHLTPLYDVMSAQPFVADHQIRRNRFKLAMSIGRHYRVHEIRPRHFEQTAREGGVPTSVVQSLLEETIDRAPRALDTTLDDLPEGFPAALADTIAAGVRSRLGTLARTA